MSPHAPLDAAIAELMTTEVASLTPETSIEAAARALVRNRVTGMSVVGYDGTVVGVLSLSDVAIALVGEDVAPQPATDHAYIDPVQLEQIVRSLDAADGESGKTVQDSMSRRLVAVPSSATVSEAAVVMAAHRVHRVLVTDEAGRLVGIFTSMDVVAVVANGLRGSRPPGPPPAP